MLRWIGDSLNFLFWFGVLQLARLVAVLFCILEVLVVLGLWGWAIAEYSASTHASWLWIPIGATFVFAIQVALWQFTWLRIAQQGGQWRAVAECFSNAVRYPVVRTRAESYEHKSSNHVDVAICLSSFLKREPRLLFPRGPK
jgi:hypothetical protein